MASDTPTTRTIDASRSESDTHFLLNAFIGGVAGIILSFIPLSTLLGGAIAGYLEDGTRTDGAKVGAIAGLIMLVPLAFMGMFVTMWMLGIGTTPAAFIMMGMVMLVFGSIYTVGLSAVGGYLGVYLKDEL